MVGPPAIPGKTQITRDTLIGARRFSTNRISFGYNTYDANGNWDRGVPPSSHYDVENRLVSGQVNHSSCLVGATSWSCACVSGDACYSATTDVYFGNKLIVSNGVTVITDRLGTVRANSNGERRVKFGTYFRDSTGFTSQDYADQRYYNFWYGRFNTPDPSSAGDPTDPASWNKYSYVEGDPINFYDPQGLFQLKPPDEPPPILPFPPIGPVRPPQTPIREPKYDYPECNKGDTAKEEANLNFLVDNYDAASALAQKSGVNVNWLLGWAAEESGYGSSGKAINNNNFVNESLPPGRVTGGWANAVACPPGASAGWACFNSFSDSLFSALYTQHETWSYPGQTTPSGLSVINAILAANPNASISQVFQGVANAGFDPVGTSTNAGYGSRIETVTKGVMRRVDCLKKAGYL